jgi:hypothetical protein
MAPRRVTVKTMNDQLRGDELVLRIIQRMARGDLPLELIDAAPHTQHLDPDRHRAGTVPLQVLSLDGFTAALDHLTTQPAPMDRDTQIRNYHYDTHTAVLELYGVLYDARTAGPWNGRIPQAHHGCEQDMKHARAVCTGEAANLQDSCIAASEYIHEAFDKAADTLNKLGIALTIDDEDDDEDKGDFDDEES